MLHFRNTRNVAGRVLKRVPSPPQARCTLAHPHPRPTHSCIKAFVTVGNKHLLQEMHIVDWDPPKAGFVIVAFKLLLGHLAIPPFWLKLQSYPDLPSGHLRHVKHSLDNSFLMLLITLPCLIFKGFEGATPIVIILLSEGNF